MDDFNTLDEFLRLAGPAPLPEPVPPLLPTGKDVRIPLRDQRKIDRTKVDGAVYAAERDADVAKGAYALWRLGQYEEFGMELDERLTRKASSIAGRNPATTHGVGCALNRLRSAQGQLSNRIVGRALDGL